ncbi:DUF2975 domain-containing protein [Rossellomorea vietnamensis]|uniref:DUF2975 domain-containing protein n=1 Tax=Rossellomorea vietnamensis TaxID=218284 RepID=A0A5D4K811_9BACI|nr:DUF2975 domain-containing protein [Rossellomorea vietnamensis]TYR73537.1 DUF2975 domain-containing protein [Rossellomorea vietnamensis]
MKRETLFLKAALFLIGAPVLALCIFGLPVMAKWGVESNSEWAWVLFGIVILMYISAIPFYFALYQAFKLLQFIDGNKAFSQLSVNALKTIKFCAAVISGLYVIGLPLFYIFAEIDDAPGVILIGMVIIAASMVIGVFAAVLQKLLKSAIDIKSENDLTV